MPVRRAAVSRRTVNVIAAAMTVTCVAGAAAIGCGSTAAPHPAGPAPEKADVTVALVPAQGATGLYVALDKGLFASAGLHVTVKTVTSSAVVIPALINGSVDVASGQYAPYIETDAGHLADIRIIAAGFALTPHVNEVMAPAHSAVKSLADLKGKTIAVNAVNSEVSDLLYSDLAANGVSPAEVKLVAVPFPAMAAALAAHQVAAAYMTEPYVTEAGQKYGDVGIGDIDTGPAVNFPIAGYAVLASWARKYPRTAAAFAHAVEEGNRIADSNIAELQHAFIAGLSLPPHVADVMATGTFPDAPDPAQIQRVADLMQHYGQLKKPFNVASMIGS